MRWPGCKAVRHDAADNKPDGRRLQLLNKGPRSNDAMFDANGRDDPHSPNARCAGGYSTGEYS